MKPTPIASPLPGEQLIGIAPTPRPEPEPSTRQRLHFWAGRALTAQALELEQESRADRLARLNQALTPGIITGLEVALEVSAPAGPLALEGHFVHVLPGHGLTALGEDVTVPRPLRVPLEAIPIVGSPAGEIPWAAVFILRPVELREFGKHEDGPCELDLSRDAFLDERRREAALLQLHVLPSEWRDDPRLGDPADPRWRNRLAHLVFSAENAGAARQQLRRFEANAESQRWSTRLQEDAPLPWELEGLPLGLLSAQTVSAGGDRRLFLDRAAVVRPGGLSRARSRPAVLLQTDPRPEVPPPAGSGTPWIWRARVDQFAEQLSELAADDPTSQAAHFQYLPPAGLLPRTALRLLNTADASLLPVSPSPSAEPGVTGEAPDRADVSLFFPPHFSVSAAPIPIEDLDAALASSAPMAPIDLASGEPEDVRVLVPVPARVFDPQLLVVELEDPFFRSEGNRLMALRQDWRQRRDRVDADAAELVRVITGASPKTSPAGELENGQTESESVETVGSSSVPAAWLSPMAPSSELELEFSEPRPVAAGSVIRLQLRVDAEAPPSRVELRLRVGESELAFAWTPETFPTVAPSVLRPDEPAPAYALWIGWLTDARLMPLPAGNVRLARLRVEGGRAALASLGPQEGERWWSAGDDGVEVTGEGWVLIEQEGTLAPFEARFLPTPPDGRTLAENFKELDDALNPPAEVAEVNPVTVSVHGLEKVLAELEAEANEADDFLDANFTRAQTNLYRIRKLILGESAAQKLLVSPAVATIAEQKTAVASAESLRLFLTEAKGKAPVAFGDVNQILNAPIRTGVTQPSRSTRRPSRAGRTGAVSGSSFTRDFTRPSNPLVIEAGSTGSFATTPAKGTTELFIREEVGTRFVGGGSAAEIAGAKFEGIGIKTAAGIQFDAATIKAESLKGVLGQLPEAGPTLPPRGLSIGERFAEPEATRNLSFARSGLNEFLLQLPRLRISLAGEIIEALKHEKDDAGRDLPRKSVSLLALQGRAQPTENKTSEVLRTEAINNLLAANTLSRDIDEAEVTLAAIDFTEIKSAILRTIERVIQRRRVLIQHGRELLAALRLTLARAEDRGALLDQRLAEARQDVAVARALWSDEVARIKGINDRRDAVLRDEVRFLAYVRPRTVDPIRRNLPSWHLESAEALAAVPACLQRHDEAPEALRSYIELFRHGPVKWFPEIAGRLAKLDTREKIAALLLSAREQAGRFVATRTAGAVQATMAPAIAATYAASFSVIESRRRIAAGLSIVRPDLANWADQRREAEEHATLGDVMDGRHGQSDVARAAAGWLEQIEEVATCLHAEFAAVSPAIRLRWVERYSQFDRPAPLRDLSVLPGFGTLPRDQRRRFQDFANWLFGRVNTSDAGAFNLVTDLIRLCLLLASHAPVNQIITGHLPRPTPVRPGGLIPIRPIQPGLVRIGMEFHVWRGLEVVARGTVEDLQDGEVSARVEHATRATLDSSVKVQFVPRALGFATKTVK